MVLQREKVGNGMNMSMDMRRDIQRLSVTIRDCCTHKRGILGYTDPCIHSAWFYCCNRYWDYVIDLYVDGGMS